MARIEYEDNRRKLARKKVDRSRQMTVNVPDVLRRPLSESAGRSGMTESEWIRQAIREKLERERGA